MANELTFCQLAEGFVSDDDDDDDGGDDDEKELDDEIDLMAALNVLSFASTPSLDISSSRDKLASTWTKEGTRTSQGQKKLTTT